MTHPGHRPGWRRSLTLCSAALAFLVAGSTVLGAVGVTAAVAGTTGQTKTTVTYVGVTGGSISFGMTQSPTGCNAHTPAGDTPGTLMVLGAVLPSPFTVSDTGAPTANLNLILQSEVVSVPPVPRRSSTR